MQPVSLVLVDFDDTLVDTAPRFQNARRSLFSVLAQQGVSAQLAQRVHHERIDPLMIARHGLGPARLDYVRVDSFVAAVNYLLNQDQP